MVKRLERFEAWQLYRSRAVLPRMVLLCVVMEHL
jgi:hypothetical protein